MTYATLQTDVITAAMRTGDTEFTAAVPGFITRAESRINRRLRVSDMETIAEAESGELTDGACALPTDFLEFRSVRANTSPKRPLRFASPDFVYEWDETTAAGIPEYFHITGNTLRTFPLSNVGITIDYYAKVPALSDDNTSNWLLVAHPDLYLYGALIEAGIFMREEGASMTQNYAQIFERALQDIHEADRRKRHPFGSVRVRGLTP
jgi:hypothetical protein